MSAQTQLAPPHMGLKRPNIRHASFDDYSQIAALEALLLGRCRSRQDWLRLWIDNPAYWQVPNWPIGWVLENDERQIVGCISNIPSMHLFREKSFISATLGDWAVDTNYRAFSLMLLARGDQHPQVDLELVTTAGPASSGILTRLGWLRPPVGEWDKSAFWVTNRARVARAYLQKKMPCLPDWIGAGLYGPLRSLDRIANWRLNLSSRLKRGWQDGIEDLLRFPRNGRRGCFELAWSSDFDKRFDSFWEELNKNNLHRFRSVRTAEILNWHFRAALNQNQIWILTGCEGPKLVGYAIFLQRPIQSLELTRMIVVDFQTLEQNRLLASSMIARALDRCRQEGIDVLENTGCWLSELQPGAVSPPFCRNGEAWTYLYKARNTELASALLDPSAWCPTSYDGDASL